VFLLTSIFAFVNATIFFHNVSRQELEAVALEVETYIENNENISPDKLNDIKQSRYIEVRVINMSNFAKSQTSSVFNDFPLPVPDQQRAYTARSDGEWGKSKSGPFGGDPRDDTRFMALTRVIERGGEQFLVQVFRRDVMEQRVLRLFALIFIIANALGLLGVFAIGKYISKLMLKPITNLSRTAERISIEDLSRRIDVEGPDDEMKQLGVTFNDMIARLENAFNQQKRFISDASHELRTPISVIQGYANMLGRWGKSDESVLNESIDSINSETKRMATLVKKLLFLAGTESKAFTMTDVSLRDVALELQKEAAIMDGGADVTINAPNPCFVSADYGSLKQLMWILVENAIKYGKRDVVVTAGENADHCFFSVKDDGAGVPPEDLPYIFERFYRADKSRSSETPGTGLGLAIAKQIAAAHNAKIGVESVVGAGALFTVEFPKNNINGG
jgi:signal transduction histidine kinase